MHHKFFLILLFAVCSLTKVSAEDAPENELPPRNEVRSDRQDRLARIACAASSNFGTILTEFEIAQQLKGKISGQDGVLDHLGWLGSRIMEERALKEDDETWVFNPHPVLNGASERETQFVIEMCKIINIPWICIDTRSVVPDGYKGGRSLSECYEKLVNNGNVVRYAVVILEGWRDEDRPMYSIIERRLEIHRSDPMSRRPSNNLIEKLWTHIEGATVNLRSGTLSTHCFTYITAKANRYIPGTSDPESTSGTLRTFRWIDQELGEQEDNARGTIYF